MATAINFGMALSAQDIAQKNRWQGFSPSGWRKKNISLLLPDAQYIVAASGNQNATDLTPRQKVIVGIAIKKQGMFPVDGITIQREGTFNPDTFVGWAEKTSRDRHSDATMHLCICFCSYVLQLEIERLLKAAGSNISIERARELVKTIMPYHTPKPAIQSRRR